MATMSEGGPSTAVTRPETPEQAVSVQSAGEVGGLIKLALDKGVPVETLRALFELQKDVRQDEARRAFFEAVAKFQRNCPAIGKEKEAKITTKNGGSFNYHYAPLEQIARQIAPVLEMCGLSYSFTTKEAAHPKVLMVVCVLRHIDGHSESADFPVPTETDAAMSGAQKVGSALTFGRRQSLVSVLGIVTGDEDDDAPDRKSAEFITPEQIEKINLKMDKNGVDFHRFVKFMGVDGIGKIPRSDFDKAMAALDGGR